MSEQDSQQPGSTPENTAEEVVMTKTLQLLLERHPQLQEWRDMLIAEQIQS